MLSEFWAMGGYGAYVWFAYGVTALFLLLLLIWSWVGARARETELDQIRKLSRAERRTPASATVTSSKEAGATPSLTVSDSGGVN